MEWLVGFFEASGLAHLAWGNLLMIVVGCVFVYLAIARGFEPLLLVPIGFGIILGNMPFEPGMGQGVYDQGSVLSYIYFGVITGIFPPLIFLGIGAMTDFSALIAQPRLILLGAAAQLGIFFTLLMAIFLGSRLPFLDLAGDDPLRLLRAAAAIGIIGGADGPTAIFIASRLAPDLLGAIAVSAYSYMALVPVIQPPIMRLLTTREERLIRMPPPPEVDRTQRILFPIIGLIVCVLIVPDTLPLLGMLFFGNLLKESGVTERLAKTARSALIDSVTIMLGLTVGASTQAGNFLTPRSIAIFALGACAFAISTAGGVLFARFYNLFTNNKINPLIGAAGVSAVPMSARVAHTLAQEEDRQNYLIWQAMCPNVAGVIGSAVAAGVLLVILR
ncbi:MAG: glutaconyl-CoA decarboxylase subunit beta [Chloroflexus sp.]|uniref:sodium ion-translocating decarboxylase subunit beta n=1 Tax=Chloroflexus sp. TaxID=1904827 RepID=UPI0021DEEB78|nr:sodium ion-translocating decarboxylase subunit beta [Chloroflexus sp.]GIV90188.1 MAG: glutaconyl-CoA decarboxylase subunit beta [Chloroflexus sp.]